MTFWLTLSAILLTSVLALLIWLYRNFVRPARTYDMRFVDPKDAEREFPPQRSASYETHGELSVCGRTNSIYLEIQLRQSIRIDRLDVSLLDDGGRWPWPSRRSRWTRPEKEVAYVDRLTDEEAALRHQLAKFRPEEGYTRDGLARRLFYDYPKYLSQGNSLWLRVEIKAGEDWTGRLSFQAETPQGKEAHSRRKLEIKVGDGTGQAWKWRWPSLKRALGR